MKLADISAGVVFGGRFYLKEILGRGSYGDVWLAEVRGGDSLPPLVALKIYHHQERATRKLLEEARYALSFDHERLVRVLGAERLDGLVVMWMEYVRGETLFQRLGDDDSPRPVALEDVLRWMREIAEALAYLHSMEPPWIHGDLKLDNILLDAGIGARLADFGQSRTIEDLFIETDGVGAWPYLAPEVLGGGADGRGQRYVSSDIYAFGVIAYRFLTGRFPRRTLSEAINLAPFPRPIELNSSVPPELDELTIKCLERRPHDRYPTGAALLAAMENLERKLSSRADVPVAAVQPTGHTFPTPGQEMAAMAKEMLEAGKTEEALDWLDNVMQRISTSPHVLLIYAEAARRVGRLDAARNVYSRVVRWMKSNGAADDELRRPYEGLAELEVRLKKYEDAVIGFNWLVERWPDNRWYRYRLGVACGLAGQYRKSLKVLHSLHEQGPSSAVVCAKIGLAWLQLNDTEQACQYFNEALMLDEYEPIALFHLARIRYLRGSMDRAFEYLDRLGRIEGAEDLYRELGRLLGKIK
jgi:eukaryotic-like serine/threonine-protein kinase